MKTRKLILGLVILTVLIFVVVISLILIFLPDGYKTPIILQGVIVTPYEVIDPGWVVVKNRKIESVASQQTEISDAIEIDTEGIIFPGLINLHDHVMWNVIPRWDPDQVFLNRYEWRLGTEENASNQEAVYGMIPDFFCQMNTYGEVRALAGGTTAIIGTSNSLCIRNLVRNLDFFSGFYLLPIVQDHSHVRNIVDLPTDVKSIQQFLADDTSEAFLIHLAEGVGPAMRAEFEQLDEQGLLTEKTIIIHGLALSADQFSRMSEQDVALIWSPRSNLELYGQTTDIASALEAGVTVAIGPDWAITGSSNILDELHLAAAWNSSYLNELISEQQLVEMVTSIPAEVAGISEFVGTIAEEKYADLIVISGDVSNPYRALLDADSESIQLVLVDGVPVYGEPTWMAHFWDPGELSQIDVVGNIKALLHPDFDQIVTDLELALSDYYFELAPIAEDVELDLSEMVVDIEPEGNPPVSTGEINWDDAIYFFGETMTVCGPVVDAYYSESEDQVPSTLYLGQPYPDINRFAVYFPNSTREKFTDDLAANYLNQEICVSGEIVVFKGAAEIVITDPSQITKP